MMVQYEADQMYKLKFLRLEFLSLLKWELILATKADGFLISRQSVQPSIIGNIISSKIMWMHVSIV